MPPKKGNIRDKVRALREKNAAAGAAPSDNGSVSSAGTEPRGEGRGEQAASGAGAGPSDSAAQQAGAEAAAAHRTEVPSLSATAQLGGPMWASVCTVRMSVRLFAHMFTVWGSVDVRADTSVAHRD